MSQRKREPERTRRTGSESAGLEQREQHERAGRPVTDEQLGLLPDAAQRRRSDTVSNVIGPDRDDRELSETGGLDFVDSHPSYADRGELDPDQNADEQEQVPIIAEESELTTVPHTLGEAPGDTPNVEPDWTDQQLLTDPAAAVGSPDTNTDPVSDADETYTPPTDPVIAPAAAGDAEVLGGFSPTGGEEVHPARSSDGQIGDEAIADAVREALRQDAATTALDIDVSVTRGVVHLRGEVVGLEDAENAEEVAARVEGVVEVQDQLQIAP